MLEVSKSLISTSSVALRGCGDEFVVLLAELAPTPAISRVGKAEDAVERRAQVVLTGEDAVLSR